MPTSRPVARLAATLCLALASWPAAAQSLQSDARCLIVSNLFAASKDARAKQAGIEARYFYLGRLSGSPAQIESALVAQSKTITAKNAPQTMQGCAQTVVERARTVQAIGQRLRGAPAGR